MGSESFILDGQKINSKHEELKKKKKKKNLNMKKLIKIQFFNRKCS